VTIYDSHEDTRDRTIQSRELTPSGCKCEAFLALIVKEVNNDMVEVAELLKEVVSRDRFAIKVQNAEKGKDKEHRRRSVFKKPLKSGNKPHLLKGLIKLTVLWHNFRHLHRCKHSNFTKLPRVMPILETVRLKKFNERRHEEVLEIRYGQDDNGCCSMKATSFFNATVRHSAFCIALLKKFLSFSATAIPGSA
jgi:hypothetical protein